MPTKAFAKEIKPLVGQVDLEYTSDSHEFDLSVVSSVNLDYELSYTFESTDSANKRGVTGVAISTSSAAVATIYAGTCSGSDCVSDEPTSGNLSLPIAGFNSDFTVIGDTLWFTQDGKSTVPSVELGTIYSAPQNNEVQVVFTKLPENPGSLSIEELTLSDQTAKEVGAYSKVAYDITSDMEDGTFEYELKLPLPEGADDKAGMVYAQSVEELKTAKSIDTDSVEGNTVKATGLNHFTVFVVVYNTQPAVMPGSYPSVGFQATSTSELGDYLQLASTQRVAQRITFELTNWACENDFTSDGSGGWIANRSNNDACMTTPGSSYTHPITLNVYEADTSGSVPVVGALVLTKTVNANIPFRPSYDDRCTAPSGDVPFGGTWYDETTGSCSHGFNFDVPFDLDGEILPDNVIVSVAYNTQSHGYSPIGSVGPFDSLNVAVGPVSPTVGINVDPDDIYWNTSHASFYTDGGAAGVGILRQDSGWTGYVPVIKIETSSPTVTTIEIPKDNTNWMFNRDTSTASPYEFNSDQASIGSGSLYALPISSNASDKFIAENFMYEDISDLRSIEYDFMIGSGGSVSDANHFYMNVYANFGESDDDKYYDCRYDVVPTTGSTTDFTTVEFDLSQSYPVYQGGSSPETCPAVPADMDSLSSGSIIRAIAINVGDTSTNDQDLDGYLDNVVVDKGAEITVYDFEPDTNAPEAPVIEYPNAEDYFNSAPILNDWSDVIDSSGIDYYRIQYEYDDGHSFSGYPYRTTTSSQRNHTPGIGEQGGVSYRVQAFDNAGNQGAWSEWRHYIYDATAPSVPVNPSHNNISIPTNNFDFDWDDSTDESSIKYEFQSSMNPAQVDGVLTTSLWHSNILPTSMIHSSGAPDGTWYWQVRAIDAAGNMSDWSEIWNVTLDTEYPNMSNIQMYVNGTLSDMAKPGDTVKITADVIDATTSVDKVQVWVREYPWSPNQNQLSAGNMTYVSGDMWEYEYVVPTTYVDGDALNQSIDGNYFNFRPYDSAGNSHIGWRENFTIDATRPVLSVTKPALDAYVKGIVTIEGLAEDTISGVNRVALHIYRLNEDTTKDLVPGCTTLPGTILGSDWSLTVNDGGSCNLTDGHYEIAAFAYDNVGNPGWASRTQFSYDETAATIVWDQPIDGSILQGPVVLGASSSELMTNFRFKWQLPGEAWVLGPNLTNSDTSYSWSFAPLVDGIYSLRAQGRDLALNWSQANDIEVTIDNTSPTGTIVSPGNINTNSSFQVTGTVADNLSGIDRVEVRLRNHPGNTFRTAWQTANLDSSGNYDTNIDVSGLADDKYEVAVVAYDKAGNNKWLWPRPVVTLDTTKPSSTITTFELEDEGSVETATFSGLIQGTATDEPTTISSGVAEVLLEIMHTPFGATQSSYWHGTDWQSGSGLVQATGTTSWSYQIPEASVLEGTYVVKSHAVDNAGNVESTYTITIVYDKTIPEVSLTTTVSCL